MSTLNGRNVLAVVALTAAATLTAADNATVRTNTGAAGQVTVSLPPATPGLRFQFGVGAAQELRIDPNGTEQISLPSTGVPAAAGKYLTCATIGATVSIACYKAGFWSVVGFTGTWTAEA